MSKKYIIIFGASSDGRRIFRYLKKRKKNKIIFLDNDIKKNNLNFLQTKIYHPKKFKLHKNISEIYLGGRYMDEQFAQLKKINEFKNIKIIKTDRWKYKPSRSEILEKEKKLVLMLNKVFKIVNPIKENLIADASTLLGLLRKQNLTYFSDLDFSIDQKKISVLHKLIKSKLKGYNITIKRYKKDILNFKKGEINQIIISEKCDLILREPNILDISAEKKRGKFFLKYDGTKNYSRVPEVFRKKFKEISYKKIIFTTPLPLVKYIEFCYGKNWKKKSKKWNNSLSKRFVKMK